MNVYSAVSIAEGFDPVYTEEEYYAAWQYLIDTGTCWKLQGWFGRTAQHFIDEGFCHLPLPSCSTFARTRKQIK